MSENENRAAVEAFWRALETKDLAGASGFLHDDFIEEWPQSGERIVGTENWMGMVTGHPTFPDITTRSTEGLGDLWVTQAHYEYPMEEGPAPFEVCAIQRVRDGRISRLTEYFAAPFEAADWRREWVELDG